MHPSKWVKAHSHLPSTKSERLNSIWQSQTNSRSVAALFGLLWGANRSAAGEQSDASGLWEWSEAQINTVAFVFTIFSNKNHVLPELYWPWTLSVTWRKERPPLWPEQWSFWPRCEKDFLQTTSTSPCTVCVASHLPPTNKVHSLVCFIATDRRALWFLFKHTALCCVLHFHVKARLNKGRYLL